MNESRFDTWTRRRFGLAAGGAAALLGLAAALPSPAGAKKQRRRKPKLKLNAFGCVDVGKPCRGKDAKCCSGICQGKKPKRGEKDKRTCAAHNTGGCGTHGDWCAGVDVPCGPNQGSFCFQTTGKAGFCAAGGPCVDCKKDKDCEATKGPGAACVVCALCPGSGTACFKAQA